MSKDLFQLMREEEVSTSNFLPTKKELVQSSKDFAYKLLDTGDITIQETYAEALRLKTAFTEIEGVLKNALGEENFEAFGITGTFRNGGDSKNYEDDLVYAELKKQLADRKELLDTALKTDVEFYDSDGVEVPKVSIKARKSSLAISY